MKKLILGWMSAALFIPTAQAQPVSGTFSGTVFDSAQVPVAGVAVFYFGQDTDFSSNVSYTKEDFRKVTYTDSLGNYYIPYSHPSNDTLAVGVIDCQGNLTAQQLQVYNTPFGRNPVINHYLTTCVPQPCDVLLTRDSTNVFGVNDYMVWEAVALIDAQFIVPNPLLGLFVRNWRFSDGYFTQSVSSGPNYDSIIRPIDSTLPANLSTCFTRYLNCANICDTLGTGTNSASISGHIFDANQTAVPGVAVFFYGRGNGISVPLDKSQYLQYTHTDTAGYYDFQYNVFAGDTIGVGVVDCNGSIILDFAVPHRNSNFQEVVDITYNSCVPGLCDVVLKRETDTFQNQPRMVWTALSLRDTSIGGSGALGALLHQWTFSDGNPGAPYGGGTNLSANLRPLDSTLPANITACYKRFSGCALTCNSASSVPLSCQADFYVDSVNSLNFQGQIVIWENSTADTGHNILNYVWDFGDGNMAQTQYPVHTYQDTGIYQVCLTITTVDTAIADSCVSTYCDSIGFDSNGNLVYKKSQQGFTINVIDPATVGQEEVDLAARFNLFPNPVNGEATLNWNAEIGVESVHIISTSGQVVKEISPESTSLKINGLPSGAYFLRIQGERGVAVKKMIVQ